MSLAKTPEQESLCATAGRFLTIATPLSRVREVMVTDTAHDAPLWRRLTEELGLTGLAVPESEGGVGLTLQELSYVAEECGRALAPSALLSTCGLCVPMLLASGDRAAKARWLPRLLEGAVGTVAWIAPGAGWETTATAARAHRDGDAWVVSGALSPVLDGMAADVLLVLADTPEGTLMLGVDADAPGVARSALPSFDQTRGLGRIELDRAPASAVGEVGSGRDILVAALDIADVVLAAEMVGGAQACLDMSVAYAQARHQFGRPIGSFQAIKHKCAEVLVEVEGARAAARYAAWCAAESPEQLPVAATVAKATAAEAYFRAAAENVQIHGGIGFTWEHDAHLYFKRAKASLAMFGDVGSYHRRLADRIGI